MKTKLIVLLPVLALSLLSYQNCTKSDFQSMDEASKEVLKATDPGASPGSDAVVTLPAPMPSSPVTPQPMKLNCPADPYLAGAVYDPVTGRFRGSKVVNHYAYEFDMPSRPPVFSKYSGQALVNGNPGSYEVDNISLVVDGGNISLLLKGLAQEIRSVSHLQVIGGSNAAQVTRIAGVGHLYLSGPLKVDSAEASHITIGSDVIVRQIKAAHVNIKAADAKNIVKSEICASWIHIYY